MFLSDVIAAVSTPRGKGGVAVIRISGDGTLEVVKRMFRGISGKAVTDFPPRHAIYGAVVTPDGSEIDRGILTYFRGPASYTGEDMAEVSCHGGVLVTREVLSCVLASGARLAEAGEFTRRAYLNGKLTLTEAEAVGELLEADTDDRRRLASSALTGRLSGKIGEIADKLCGVMSALYAAIDYPEEDIGDMGEREIGDVIEESLLEIGKLLSTYKKGKAVSDGVKCVICGKPNAGKSSLYNLITGEDSAIVTDIAGTTRDVLRERVSFGGVTLELCDTAGLRETEDSVESIGVKRAEAEMEKAELLVGVFDGSTPLSESEKAMMAKYPSDCARLAVINKSDLTRGMTEDDLKLIEDSHDGVVSISCEDGTGIDSLAVKIGELYDAGSCEIGRDAIIWSARQEATLRRAHEYLTAAKESFEYGDPVDAVCTLCEGALSELSETDGRGVSEEIVSGIFAKFCVGK
ncbi:MAG: tRNA uridine-5-carboxymethylaminomethyl(34) synthesis GTPase MnmE [Clostridia bacterium]|nr:tRNA uridine-5-carboxymethylaminomethyl(34) synthesis GTPase MnmE [Clostridia bacterium]